MLERGDKTLLPEAQMSRCMGEKQGGHRGSYGNMACHLHGRGDGTQWRSAERCWKVPGGVRVREQA